jgi:SAM-dependent methyltransferase
MGLMQTIKSTLRSARRVLGYGASRSRRRANKWLRQHCSAITGDVLSLGSGDDADGEGADYRSYFRSCRSYTTSEVSAVSDCDLVLDIRSMPQVDDEKYDCIFCSGVLEHVDDFLSALAEITRVLRPGGVLLLGTPLRQPIHMSPNDFWRFTEFGLRRLLAEDFDLMEIAAIDERQPGFPAAYWTKAVRKKR